MGKLKSIKNAATAAANVGRAALAGNDITVSTETLEQRRAICDACEYRDAGVCTVCTCNISAKTSLATERCPRGYWPNVTAVKQKVAHGAHILEHEVELLELLIPHREQAKLPAAFSHLHAKVAIASCTACARKQWYRKLEAALNHDKQFIDIHDLRAMFYPSTHLRVGATMVNLLPTHLQ